MFVYKLSGCSIESQSSHLKMSIFKISNFQWHCSLINLGRDKFRLEGYFFTSQESQKKAFNFKEKGAS